MKKLTIVFVLFLFQNISSQINFGENWKIDKIIGLDLKNAQEFTLHKFEKSKRANYGNKVIFDEDGTFSCHYSARCGNDCFTSSYGTFEIITSNKIKLTVTKITRFGYCSGKEKETILNTDLGTYTILAESETKVKFISENSTE